MFTGAFCFGTQIVRMFANFCDRRLPSDTQNFEARAVVYANNLEKSCLEATILWTTENQTMCLSTLFVVSLFWVLIWTFRYSVSSSDISFSSSPWKDIPPKMVTWSFLGPSKWRNSKRENDHVTIFCFFRGAHVNAVIAVAISKKYILQLICVKKDSFYPIQVLETKFFNFWFISQWPKNWLKK